MRTASAALNGATIVAALLALASLFSSPAVPQDAVRARVVSNTASSPDVARLEVRVMKLEQALVELRGNIKEYHFSTAAGSFVCGRCKIEEDDHVK